MSLMQACRDQKQRDVRHYSVCDTQAANKPGGFVVMRLGSGGQMRHEPVGCFCASTPALQDISQGVGRAHVDESIHYGDVQIALLKEELIIT